MSTERYVDQVYGILSKAGIAFDTREDGRQYRIRYDSAYVFVGFREVGDDALVTLTCPLLQEVDVAVPGRERLLEAVNRFNCATLLGKACWYEERRQVDVEHYLRADDLQAAELVHALAMIAASVERHDDELQHELGTGRRGADVWAADDDEEVLEA